MNTELGNVAYGILNALLANPYYLECNRIPFNGEISESGARVVVRDAFIIAEWMIKRDQAELDKESPPKMTTSS